MNLFRQHPLFAAALCLGGLLLAGEGWCVYERSQAAARALARVEQKRREVRALAGVEPAPVSANADAIEADLAQATQALEAMRTELQGRGAAAERLRTTPVPERPADAYFDLAEFVEKMRERAGQAGVAVKPDEHFGFADYANTGPEAGRIGGVFRERLVLEYLLTSLFDAHPRRLLSVQRERPPTAEEVAVHAASSAAGSSGGQSPDIFEIDPSITARVPGLVDTTAFRLVFIGQTAALRVLLNKLASFELPLVVRSVEVERAPFEERSSRDAVDAAVPLVPAASSRFTVTVELVELVVPPPAA